MESVTDGALRLLKIGPLGPFSNNSYVIADTTSGEAAIIDMPDQGERVLEATAGLRVTSIILTHTHPDHWASYELLTKATGAPVYCHPARTLLPAHLSVAHPLLDGDEIDVGSVRLRVIETPGHTPDCVCLLTGRHLIAGDTLFPGGPGHTRRPEDLRQEIESITGRLYVLPDETVVYPGHGANTTIGASKAEYALFAGRPQRPDLCGDVLWSGA